MEKIYVVKTDYKYGLSELVAAYFNEEHARIKMKEVLDEWVDEEFNSYSNTQSKKELKEIAEIHDDYIQYSEDCVHIEVLDLHK